MVRIIIVMKWISFCLPLYNVKKYAYDCIMSIIQQDILVDEYEIICIDDSSTDGSYELVQDIASKYAQIRVFKNDVNMGVSYTRNKCIQLAEGDYIWFVDPDDMLYPGVVSGFIDCIKKTGEKVIRCNYIKAPEEATLNNYVKKSGPLFFEAMNYKDGYINIADDGERAYMLWGGVYNRRFLIENSLFLDENMVVQEDVMFAFEISLVLDTVQKTNQPCYIYRQRKTSVMHNKSDDRMKKYYISMVKMLDTYVNHLTNGEYKDKEYLETRIQFVKESSAKYLLFIPDTQYVKEQLKLLKDKGYYPYKMRKECFKQSSTLRAMFEYVIPIEPLFWIDHFLYKWILRTHFQN